MDAKTFQKIITNYMIDTDTSKNDLMRLICVSRPTFNKYWNEPGTMPVNLLKRICDYFSISDSDKANLI